MRVSPNKILIFIACAFVVTALAFIGTSVASFVVLSDIDRATTDLLGNALPSVRALTHARGEVRELRVAASELARSRPPRDVSSLEAERKSLDSAVAEETETPWFPGEREVYETQARPALTELDLAIVDLEQHADAPPTDAGLRRAMERFDSAAARADATLEAWSDVNHNGAFAGAVQIARNKRQATRVTLYLDIISTIVAFIAAMLAIELTRRFEQMMRRNLELEAERAEQLDLVAQRVAHDLMSPLAAVSLSLGCVLRKHKDDETARAVDRAQRVLERSRRMVHSIYAFAQSSAAPARDAATPLRSAVRDATGALQAVEGDNKGPEVEVEDFDDVEVRMDRGMLDIVLSNLLSNAAKYTVGAPVRRITVRARADARRVHVEVQDTGSGVPLELSEAIFQPYKRAPGTTQPGLGLGLATVKRLVLGHGGAVGVRNAPSGGAVFWFELPLAPQPATVADATTEGAAGVDRLHPRPSG